MILDTIKYQLEKFSKPSVEKYLLAVSGGKDSMVMLDVFIKLGLHFEVAHMNYQLRGEDADQDEMLVREQCERGRIRCHLKRVDTKSFCQENGYSTQEGARILRYNWFKVLLLNQASHWIVTAHHLEDNKETFIQNLKRGSGLRGLKSMLPSMDNRLKPMLSISREEIDSYVEENKILFRQDASNNQNQYQRNLIRNELLPLMDRILPGIGKGIESSIQDLQDDFTYLMNSLERDAKEHLIKSGKGFRIDQYRLLEPRLLLFLLEKFDFNKIQVGDIFSSEGSGKKILSRDYIAETSYGNIFIYKRIEAEEFVISVEGIGEYDLQGSKLLIEYSEIPQKFDHNKNVAYIDAEKLSWPLIIRQYQNGDRIQPIGMSGTKKLSDYFTDQKIPSHQRTEKKVVVSSDEIVWVIGELISDRMKITSTTKKVLKLETF
ncbi:MAG: tRNA lysidine(34) synthetase TilS [Flavobacteriales bacterium]|nr:tRNA lysidine(34) synthetase TilS [Flavobacteriales bacterium]MCB9197981.1 tRNA lysidine(34) synthetase TilS [Flavobacteriales bacterium]